MTDPPRLSSLFAYFIFFASKLSPFLRLIGVIFTLVLKRQFFVNL